MQIGLKNINKIIEGTVVLDGLTVLAGVNDTGKSTVGKTLFALIKSIINVKKHTGDYRTRETLKLIVFLYNKLSRLDIENNSIGLPSTAGELSEILFRDLDGLNFLSYIQSNIESLDITPSSKYSILSDIENIKIQLEGRTKPWKAFKNELNLSIEAEFLNNICRKGSDISEITFREQDTQDELHVVLKNNKVVKTSILNIADYTLEDATFVESPLYIHMIDTLRYSSTLREEPTRKTLPLRPYVNYHVKDMAEKLDSLRFKYNQYSLFKDADLFDNDLNIDKIIGGKFLYSEKLRKLYWEKDGMTYSPENVASGIKSFGVIQMLLETYSIGSNKILILDEPENHLHPEWQIKFAELLVNMAAKGIPILISSHSPYFIQAIRYFSNGKISDKYVRYYLIDEITNGGSVIEDVSNDLNKVFKKLTAPMNKIMNLGR